MPYVCVVLGIACLIFAWKLQTVSPTVAIILFVIGLVAILPARIEAFPRFLHRCVAVIATALCFISFGAFFSFTPELTVGWYLTPFATPYLGLVLGGLTAMTAISENSCCLKVDQTLLEVPQCVAMASNLRRRWDQFRTT